MQRTTLSLAISLGAMLQVSLVSGQTHSDLRVKDVERQMNVVFILADDLGICDIRAFAQRFTGTVIQKMYYETAVQYLKRLWIGN